MLHSRAAALMSPQLRKHLTCSIHRNPVHPESPWEAFLTVQEEKFHGITALFTSAKRNITCVQWVLLATLSPPEPVSQITAERIRAKVFGKT